MTEHDEFTPMQDIGPEPTENMFKYDKDELSRFISGGYKDMAKDDAVSEAATYFYIVAAAEDGVQEKDQTLTQQQSKKLQSILSELLDDGKNTKALATVNDYFSFTQALTIESKDRDSYNNRALGNAWRLTYMLSNMKSIEFVGMLDAHGDAGELKDATQWNEEWASLKNTVTSDSGMLHDLVLGWSFVKQELRMNHSWFTLLQLVSEKVQTTSVDLLAHHYLEDDGVLGRLSREAKFVSFLADANYKDAPHYAELSKTLDEMKSIPDMVPHDDPELVDNVRKLIDTNDNMQELGNALHGYVLGLYYGSKLVRK